MWSITTKYGASSHFLSLSISTSEHLKFMSNIWFDAEFNRLQHTSIIFLAIVSWYWHSINKSEDKALNNVKKYSILTFSISYKDYGAILYIQFCRASRALSIGIWLNLNGEKVEGKIFQYKYGIVLKKGKIWCERSIFRSDYLGPRKLWNNVQYMFWCRIRWAIKW